MKLIEANLLTRVRNPDGRPKLLEKIKNWQYSYLSGWTLVLSEISKSYVSASVIVREHNQRVASGAKIDSFQAMWQFFNNGFRSPVAQKEMEAVVPRYELHRRRHIGTVNSVLRQAFVNAYQLQLLWQLFNRDFKVVGKVEKQVKEAMKPKSVSKRSWSKLFIQARRYFSLEEIMAMSTDELASAIAEKEREVSE